MTLFLRRDSRLDDPLHADNSVLFTPNVSSQQAIGAFIESATQGVGTLAADVEEREVRAAQGQGDAYGFDDFAQTDFAKRGVKWVPGINDKSAGLLLDHLEKTKAREEIIASATTTQAAAGYAAALVAGTFEPKNLAYGVATSAILSPFVGAFAPVASNLKRIHQLRQAGQRLGATEYATLAGTGAVEGLVSAAIMEPSNIHTAKVLQEDYTAADTMWNIATSTLFGSAFSAAPSFIKDRFIKKPNKAVDVAIQEFDTAVSQVAAGQKVDVSHVELSAIQREMVHVLRNDMRDIPSAQKLSEHIAENESRLNAVAPELVATNRVLRGVIDDYQATIAEAEVIQAELQQASTDALAPETIQRVTFLERELEKTDLPAELRQAIESEIETLVPDSAKAVEFAQQNTKQMRAKLNKLSKLQKRIDEKMGEFTAQAKPFFDLAKTASDNISKELNSRLVKSIAPENDAALNVEAIKEINEAIETYGDNPEKKFNETMATLQAMEKEGLISESTMEELNNAINSLNEKDLEEGYKVLAGCLLRGEV